MLLRVNSEMNDTETDLQAITSGSSVKSGVPAGEVLSRLVEVTLRPHEAQHTPEEIRQSVVDELGGAGLVDAAAIIGNFQRMTRIADGTGIPLDKPVSVMSASLREEIGIDQFGSADLTPKVGRFAKWAGNRLRPILIKQMLKRRAGAE